MTQPSRRHRSEVNARRGGHRRSLATALLIGAGVGAGCFLVVVLVAALSGFGSSEDPEVGGARTTSGELTASGGARVEVPTALEAPPRTELPNPVIVFHERVVAELANIDRADHPAVLDKTAQLLEQAPPDAAMATLGLLERNRGEALALDGDLPGAEVALSSAVDRRPEDDAAWFGLGRVVYQQLRCADSIPFLQRSVDLLEGNSAYHGTLAFALECDARYEEALVHLDLAVELDPENAGARGGRALVLNALGRHAEAVIDGREAVRQRPDVASHHLDLAVALEETGATAEALSEYRKVLQLEPTNRQATEGRARLQ